MTAGIYRIVGPGPQSSTAAKVYIGSAQSLDYRRGRHWRDLRRGDHPNKKLQRAWNKYGEKAFAFEVLEVVPEKAQLLEREQVWLDMYMATKFGYNIAPTAGAPTRGLKMSDETKAKMSAAQKGRKHGPMREEQKEHYSRLYKGRSLSEETRRRMSEARKGRVFSEESRAKMSAAAKGRPKSEAHKAALREANLGKTATEATKAKMSAAQKKLVESGLHNWVRPKE